MKINLLLLVLLLSFTGCFTGSSEDEGSENRFSKNISKIEVNGPEEFKITETVMTYEYSMEIYVNSGVSHGKISINNLPLDFNSSNNGNNVLRFEGIRSSNKEEILINLRIFDSSDISIEEHNEINIIDYN